MRYTYTSSLIAPLIPISGMMVYLSYDLPLKCCIERTLKTLSQIVIYDTITSFGRVGKVAIGMEGGCTVLSAEGLGRIMNGGGCTISLVGKGVSTLVPLLSVGYQIYYSILLFVTFLVMGYMWISRKSSSLSSYDQNEDEDSSSGILRFDYEEMKKLRNCLMTIMLGKDILGVVICGLNCLALFLPLLDEDGNGSSEDIINVSVGWGFALTFMIVAIGCFSTLVFERESVLPNPVSLSLPFVAKDDVRLALYGQNQAQAIQAERTRTVDMEMEKIPLLVVDDDEDCEA